MPTAAPVKPGQAPATGKNAPVMARGFRIGVQSTDEIDYDVSPTLTAGTQDLPVLNIPAAGFLQDLYLLVEATWTAGAAVVAYFEDGPFNVIDTVSFEDVNNAPIVGPITGWDLYIINKYGGYWHLDDPRFSPAYRAEAAAASTGFGFCLRVPVELVKRDGLGALPNKSGSAQFKLRLRLAANSTVFSTLPSNPVTVRVRVQQADWWEPDATDLKGRPLSQNPPAVQTTQVWSKADYPVNAGSMRQKFDRVGFMIRNLVFVLRGTTAATARANGETDFPDPFILRIEANNQITRLKRLWQHQMAARGYMGNGPTVGALGIYAGVGDNYTGTAAQTASKDNGVYTEPYCHDFGHRPGWETRRGYLSTSAQARLEGQGTVGATTAGHTFTVITNDVAPANGDDASIVA